MNAPGTPDPTIAFTTERGQIQPVLAGEGGGPTLIAGDSIPVGAR